jgi:DNA-binding NarL/FixJ family response regulator
MSAIVPIGNNAGNEAAQADGRGAGEGLAAGDNLTMNRIVLADDQAIFRAGAARVLALEDDMRIVAQCDEPTRFTSALSSHPGAVVIFSAGLRLDLGATAASIRECGSVGILVAEKGQPVADAVAADLGGVIGRSITSADLIDSVRRVARGQRCVQRASVTTMQPHDAVGERVRDRLTPKEMQIVALIVQGRKNKDIALQLGTKEQVIKNYLRNIYDKIGVSDRLELALFTLHHRLLAEAAAQAGTLLQRRSA